MSGFSANCVELGCNKCCKFRKGYYAPVGANEAKTLGLNFDVREDGSLGLRQQPERDENGCSACEYLVDGKCSRFETRPHICQYFPLVMLDRERMGFSYRCTFVHQVLLPRLDRQGGFTDEDRVELRRLKKEMQEDLKDNLDVWGRLTNTAEKYELVLEIKV